MSIVISLLICLSSIIGPISTQSTRSNNEQQCDCEESTVRQTETSQALAKILAELTDIKSRCNVTAQQQQTKPVCPSGFTYYRDVDGCYKLGLVPYSWSDAGQYCRIMHKDAHLVVVNNLGEQIQIINMMRGHNETIPASCSAYYSSSMWTAGQRLDPTSKQSPFVYRLVSTQGSGRSDDVMEMTYTNWEVGQPDNYAGVLEACMALSGYTSTYKWHDSVCSLNMCFICEVDMS